MYYPVNTDDYAIYLRDANYDTSVYVSDDVAWSEDGQLIAVMRSDSAGREVPIAHNLLEVNPLLDASLEPQESTVREGAVDLLGDTQSLGAIKVANSTIIEAAVAAALEAYDGPTRAEATTDKDAIITGNDAIITVVDANEAKLDIIDAIVDAIKAKTDSLDFVGGDIKATLDSELVKLAADGWDSLSIDEPSGDPDGWTVPQKLMWLIMRFMNKHTSDNFDGIKVHKADDSLATTQSVTEAAGVKTVGKAT